MQLALTAMDNVRNGFKEARIITVLDTGTFRGHSSIVRIVNATCRIDANYDGAHALNICLLIVTEQTARCNSVCLRRAKLQIAVDCLG